MAKGGKVEIIPADSFLVALKTMKETNQSH